MNPLILIGIFAIATIIGYFLIKKVPSLLHTPLMSGMNALSGITVLGALTATAIAVSELNVVVGAVVGGLAVMLSIINVAGGFAVTHRMLQLFNRKKHGKSKEESK